MNYLPSYNLKLLFSPLKWLCCLIFILLIATIMYAPTYYDFTNICEIYLPFIGVILITDVMLINQHNNMAEILYVLNSNQKKDFLFRYFIIVILIVIFIFLADMTFSIQQYFNGGPFLYEPITHLEFLIISFSGTLFLGTLSMTIGNLLTNQYIGYGFSLVYWLYWNVNCQKQSIFNLFPFVANPNEYIFYVLIEFTFIIFLIFLNTILAKKSPFFIIDKISKIH